MLHGRVGHATMEWNYRSTITAEPSHGRRESPSRHIETSRQAAERGNGINSADDPHDHIIIYSIIYTHTVSSPVYTYIMYDHADIL